MFMVADIHRRLIVGWLLCVVAAMLQVSLLCRGPGRAGGWLLLTVLAAMVRTESLATVQQLVLHQPQHESPPHVTARGRYTLLSHIHCIMLYVLLII